MFCSKCGAQVKDTDAFCLKCGAPIKRVTPAASVNAAPPAQPSAPAQAAAPAQYAAPNPAAAPPQYAACAAPAPNGRQSVPGAQQPAVDWTRMQPRTRRAPATALILCLGMLLAFAIFFIWAVAYLSPGGIGENELATTAAVPGATSPAGPADSDPARPVEETSALPTGPASAQSGDPADLPAAMLSQLNPDATRSAYYGSYTGTMRVDTYNLKTLAELSGGSLDQIEMFESLAGQRYSATAEFDGSRVKLYSDDFPYGSPGNTVLELSVSSEPALGLSAAEERDADDDEGYEVRNSQRTWFLTEGRLYLVNAMSVWKDDAYIGGVVFSAELQPAG